MRSLRSLGLASAAIPLLAACSSPAPTPSPPAALQHSVGANDVSVLFPLATTETELGLLPKLDMEGRGGPLLTKAQFDEIVLFRALPVDADGGTPTSPDGGLDSNRVASDASRYRIVAARIDPCFPTLAALDTNPSACHRQLRLVAQPLALGTAVNGGGAGDIAIHLLYEFDVATFDQLAKEWLSLATPESANLSVALSVHPTIAKEGLAGKTAAGYVNLIKKYAGSSNLVRFTAMDGSAFIAWSWAGYDVVGSGIRPVAIHGMTTADTSVETISTDPTINGPFKVLGAPTELTALLPLAGEVQGGSGLQSGAVVLTASDAEIRSAQQKAFDYQNPTTAFHPETLDCVSCHVASRAKNFAESRGHSTAGLARYANSRRNTNIDFVAGITNQISAFRSFGYLAYQPITNERVVNESAAVADALEKRYNIR